MATLPFTPKHGEAHVFSIANKALKLSSAEDIKPHLDRLLKLDRVTKIDLSGNTIGIDASIALAHCIEEHSAVFQNLTEVNFADLYTARLVDEVVKSLQALLPALLKCSRLSIVNLSDNAFGLRTIDSLEYFISNATSVEHLILSNNGMGPFAGERIGKALFKLAQNKEKRKTQPPPPPLKTFICGRNRLENGAALYLALGLKAHGRNLQNVKLYQNGIRPRGIVTLFEYGFRFCSVLQILDLQDNTFTTPASSVLAKYLPLWEKSLVELNLNDCLLKGKGADQVLKQFTLHTFKNLITLKLEYNEIEQESLENHLLNAIESDRLPALKTLEINGNRLDEDSEALDTLQAIFEDLELDDLEEIDSDEEDESETEQEDESEKFKEVDIEPLEKQLSDLQIDSLANALAKTEI